VRFVIIIFYLLYFISGGYRNYSFEYEFFQNVKGIYINPSLITLTKFSEVILMGLVAFSILNPLRKYPHLLIASLLFLLDLIFQNHVRFRASIIIINMAPFLFFLFLHFKDKKNLLTYFSVLLVSIGYLSAFVSKVSSGWTSLNNLVVYSYLVQFNLGYHIQLFLSNFFLKIKSVAFWKFADYIVLFFQGLFVVNFFTKKYFVLLAILAVIFHVSILMILNIPVFYPYILVYSLIIAFQYFEYQEINKYNINWRLSVSVSLIGVVASYLWSSQFISIVMPYSIYLLRDYAFNFVSVLCFGFVVFRYFTINKSLYFNYDGISSKH
jgi:hypothetical protein